MRRAKGLAKAWKPDPSKRCWLCAKCGTQMPIAKRKPWHCGVPMSPVVAGTIREESGLFVGDDGQLSLF